LGILSYISLFCIFVSTGKSSCILHFGKGTNKGNIQPSLGTPGSKLMTLQKLPNVMAALPNIGGALYSTPQTLADAHYSSAVQ